MDHWLRETLISHSMTVGYEPQTNGMAEPSLASWQEVAGRCCVRLELPECCGQSTAFINEVRNREKPMTNDIATEPLLLELRENDENAGGNREHVSNSGLRGDAERLRYYHQRRETTTKLAPMGVCVGDGRTIVNGTRIGVPQDNFCSSGQPVQEIVVSTTVRRKETTVPMTDTNVKILEQMRGLLTEAMEKSQHRRQQRGQRRRREDEGDGTNHRQDENEDEIGQIVVCTFEERDQTRENDNDVRSRSPARSRRLAA